MRKLFMSIAVLLATVTLLGCGVFYSAFPRPDPTPLATQSAQKLPRLEGEWLIRMTLTGGVAGRDRAVEISSSGQMTVTDQRSHKEEKTQLSADQIARLVEVVASSRYRPPSGPESGCADCFIYNLEISSGSKKFQAQLDDISLPDSGLQTLISFIDELSN